MRRVLTAAAVLLIPLATTCGAATDDRQGGNGSQPDAFSNATHVVVYRNADSVPNLAYFCAGQYGWAATLTGTDAAENKPATIVRFPDYDAACTR